VNIDGFGHFGALYKFNQATGGANNAFQAVIGGEYAGFSIDAYYSKIHDAIAVNALTAAQVGDLAGLGLSDSNTLRATVSDNTSWAVLALYDLGVVKFYAGFEHIQFADPRDPFTTGINVAAYDIPLSFLTQTAYPTDREQQVYWAGVRYTVVPDLDLVGAYYAYHQNSYGIGANAGCDSNQAATCSGRTEAISFDAVYRLSRRFDTYLGALYTGVLNGQANGYVLHTTDITTTWGVRFKF
jgi:predicted porin